ncbi:hypothetical protein [Nocardiopsis salina]|uniref:hypothetical protein n=1 Tax=Nocardiopsis salina TaxID=245836 RepID=UPI000348FD9F|nr:hypothetical protein [Nocardiopsis salina]
MTRWRGSAVPPPHRPPSVEEKAPRHDRDTLHPRSPRSTPETAPQRGLGRHPHRPGAFTSIGLEFELGSLREAGRRPIGVFASATVFNLLLGLALAVVLFQGFVF